MRRLIAFFGMATAATVVLSVGGPGALLPFKAAAQAVTEVSVAFVIDFSGSGGVQSACVKVPSTDNEYQALALFTQQEHEAAPSYNSSGLLCSIGGVPSSGCGQAQGHGYIYWSYWHGDSSHWQYSNTGASGIVHTCNSQGANCDVEGWKFENSGAGNPTDPPPQSPPDYGSICASTPATTTTPSGTPSTTSAPPATTSVTQTSSPNTSTSLPVPPNSVPPSGLPASPTPSTAGVASTGTSSLTPASVQTASEGATSNGGTGSSTTGPGIATTATGTPGSLASTGPGPGVRWVGVSGVILFVAGVTLWVLHAYTLRPKRLTNVSFVSRSPLGFPSQPRPRNRLRHRAVWCAKTVGTWILGR